MDYKLISVKRVYPNDRIAFKCMECGDCCRHVSKRIPLESLDVYRIVKHLEIAGKNPGDISEALLKFAEPVILDDCGFFYYFLRVRGEDDSCIFLADNKCTIHKAKPRACRLYPFSVHPNCREYYLCQEKQHHFTGSDVRVRSWMKKRFTEEDKAFVCDDYSAVIPIVELMRRIPDARRMDAMEAFVRYKYLNYRLDAPFLDQFVENQKKLILTLEGFLP